MGIGLIGILVQWEFGRMGILVKWEFWSEKNVRPRILANWNFSLKYPSLMMSPLKYLNHRA